MITIIFIIDLINRRFGRLTVLKLTGKTRHGHLLWLCQCDCGNQKNVTGMALKKGDTVSCKCYQKEMLRKSLRKSKGTAGFNSLFMRYKHTAKRKNRDFFLTKKYFKELTSSSCYYCGKTPTQIYKGTQSKNIDSINHSLYRYNGIDRLDNNKGYIIRNVVACCKTCNFFKSNISHDVFLDTIKHIYEYRLK